jgi:hypothetical protein
MRSHDGAAAANSGPEFRTSRLCASLDKHIKLGEFCHILIGNSDTNDEQKCAADRFGRARSVAARDANGERIVQLRAVFNDRDARLPPGD